MKKVGIVILNYNGSEYLKVTLDALVRAKTNVSYEVGIIDNGSRAKEAQKVKQYFNYYSENTKLKGFLVLSEKNLGFSGGNNIIIKKFLEDLEITHICLLNSDVIVTDYWLDYLTIDDTKIMGPVTNAAGNEQTIQIDYMVDNDLKAFDSVNAFSIKRHNIYDDYVINTDILYFFNTVIPRKIIEEVGVLDEQFYPGSFEDNDYCLRVLKAGYEMVINRGCFVHHFGSGSFAKLDMPQRMEITNKNRFLFEEKWNIHWKDTTWKLLESCKQDTLYINQKDSWAVSLIIDGITKIEEILENWSEAIAFYQSEQYINSLKNNAPYGEGRSDYKVPQIPSQMASIDFFSGKQLLKLAYIKAIKKAKRILGIKKKIKTSKEIMLLFEKIERNFLDNTETICVFAPMFDESNEKDGYIQRIKEIDKSVLNEFLKIYLYDDSIPRANIKVTNIDDNHIYILFNSHDKEQRNEIFQIVKKSKRFYTHSINRFMSDSVHAEMCQLFYLPDVKRIWDVHGAVPEEYMLNGSELGCQIANEVERFIYMNTDLIIVVSQQMKRLLQKKYGLSEGLIISLPIFNQKVYNMQDMIEMKSQLIKDKPTIVYAGGVQQWQNIELMQQIIEKTQDIFQYRIFVPSPQLFLKGWECEREMKNVLVDSRKPEEMEAEYLKSHYGLVLRDDITVNNVACPTKIIEYLQYGIIPILKSSAIGDFVDMGMKFVRYEDLMKSDLPNEDMRISMIKENYKVLQRIEEAYETGLKLVKDTLMD